MGINYPSVGAKLRTARVRVGLTQDDVAKELGLSRTTLVAIESGQRSVKNAELVSLALLYGVNMNKLIRVSDVIDLSKVLLRAPRGVKNKERLRDAINEFAMLLEDYISLELLTNMPLRREYPQVVPLYSHNDLEAEQLARSERSRLNLGVVPYTDLRWILENKIGIRIFYLYTMPSDVAGFYYYHDDYGACIAVNSLHTEERQRYTLIHEYFHFLTDRYKEKMIYEKVKYKDKIEAMSEMFTSNFLMPRELMLDLFRDRNTYSVGELVRVGFNLGVSFQALLYRLEGMGKIDSDIISQVRGIQRYKSENEMIREKESMLPERFAKLVIIAFKDRKITELECSRLMRISVVDARRFVSESVSI